MWHLVMLGATHGSPADVQEGAAERSDGKQEAGSEAASVDCGAQTPPSVACPRPDGSRARDESGEARRARQPPAGAVEAAAARVHRTGLREAVREGVAGSRH